MAKAQQVSGAWRALQRACSLVFAICGVSEVTPPFIPVVLEAEAREAKKGLWADPQPVPPWEWRKRKERELADIIAWC